MQQFIYILRLQPKYQSQDNWTDETNAVVGEHFAHLQHQLQQGILVLAGRTNYDVDNKNTFGIVIFKAESPEAAEQFMQSDPAIVRGVMTAEVHPFSIALM